MDEKKELAEFKRDNQRLCDALREIQKKMGEISEILDSVKDLTVINEPERHAPVTEDEVKNLLKKYSRLS